ncbi:MAG: hypothetical protein ACK42K_06885, partial [Leptonema sp. (in: bacteria)]
FLFIFILLFVFKNMDSSEFSVFWGIKNINSNKIVTTGFKYSYLFLFNQDKCSNFLCPSGAGSEIFYPVRNNVLSVGLNYNKQLSNCRFKIEYGESRKQIGSYDIDFYTFPYTGYKPFNFDNLFYRKDSIYVWNNYIVFNKSESSIKQKYYNLEFRYTIELYQYLDFILKINYERENYYLFDAFNPYIKLFINTNVHFLYNDYYIIGSGFSFPILKLKNLKIKSGILFLLGILHFDFYHPLRYLEFVGDNIGNGYELFLNMNFNINKKSSIIIEFRKEKFYTLTPKFAHGTEIRKYSVVEIQNVIASGGRGPEFQIHKEIFSGSIYYEFKL